MFFFMFFMLILYGLILNQIFGLLNLLSRKAAIWRTLRLNYSSDLFVKYCKIAQQYKNAIYEYDSGRERRLLDTNNLGAF